MDISEIHIGDRVVCTINYEDADTAGKAGYVFGFSNNDGRPCVEFDDLIHKLGTAYTVGHSGLSRISTQLGKMGHCWYVSPEYLKPEYTYHNIVTGDMKLLFGEDGEFFE